jgi:hypothetical protein
MTIARSEIVDLLDRAQGALPADRRRGFIERSTDRIGGFLSQHQHALVGAGTGYVVGTIVDHLPIVRMLTGHHGAAIGALVGAWIGNGRDQRERELRNRVAKIVAEELAAARAS